MNKMGKMRRTFESVENTWSKVKNSYIYRLFRKIVSVISTLILVFLLVIGAAMFYFNMKAKSYAEQGINYTAPFGLYTIISGSMQPAINVYDVVVSAEVKDLNTIKVGDVITFVSSWDMNYGKTVTHRVISISKNENGEFQFVTKGDWNQSADGAVVTQSNLVGKVILRIPQLGRVQFFLATKLGWFLVVFIPALLIIVWDLIKIFKLYILKDKINNVKDAKTADKIYFENDLLDNRELSNDKLEKTLTLGVIDEKDISIKLQNGQYTNDEFIKLKPSKKLMPRVFKREPIKTRDSKEIQPKLLSRPVREEKVTENVRQVLPTRDTQKNDEQVVEKKILSKRKKL